MCVEGPIDPAHRKTGTIVIKLIILFAVLGFGLAVLLIGVEAAAGGLFVSIVVGAAVKAAAKFTDEPDADPDGEAIGDAA